MKRENIVINGVSFENMGTSSSPEVRGYVYCPSDIYYHYTRPSCYKVSIWKDWCDWAEAISEADTDNFAWVEITSANSQVFTVSGQVRENGHSYAVKITKMHNRARLIK